jgi:hypothetical protein
MSFKQFELEFQLTPLWGDCKELLKLIVFNDNDYIETNDQPRSLSYLPVQVALVFLCKRKDYLEEHLARVRYLAQVLMFYI